VAGEEELSSLAFLKPEACRNLNLSVPYIISEQEEALGITVAEFYS
jgi:hypothetical protein